MTTGKSGGYRTRREPLRIGKLGLPDTPTVVGAAIAYLVCVGIAALVPALGGFAELPIWQLTPLLIGVSIAAVAIDQVVTRVVGTLAASTAHNPERSRYTVVDAISGVVLLGVLTLGLSLVFASGTAFVAAVIIAVLSGILPAVLRRSA